MKLKRGEILELHQALTSLDGFPKVVGEKVVLVPYSFTDETRRMIVRNRRILKPFVEEYEARRLEIIREVADDGSTFVALDDHPKQAEFAVKDRAERASLHNVEGLYVFERSELFRENRNPIPGSVEDSLAPVIKGALEEAPKAAVPEGGE